jgi:polysaccharide pyruvyl transferase WcaK-like protein
VKTSRPVTVGVLGHYGQLNLGDESITAATISGIRRARPDSRVIAISLDPGDTAARHGVRSVALRRTVSRTPIEPPPAWLASPAASDASRAASPRRGVRGLARRVRVLRRAYRGAATLPARAAALFGELVALRRAWGVLADVDLVIVAGSNQLLDHFGGAWGFPYTLAKWSALARLRGARVVVLSVGAGPLDGWVSRRLVLGTLRRAEYVSVRDPGSARLLREIGWPRPVPVMPDLAFALDPESTGTADGLAGLRPPQGGSLSVAVNLAPVHDPRYWPRANPELRARYVSAMRGFLQRLLAHGHRVELFGTQPVDEWTAAEVVESLDPVSHGHGLVSLAKVRSLDELGDVYRRADVVLATRFHGILLALRFGRPVLGVCYYRKSRELLSSFGLERYAFDLPDVSAPALGAGFDALVAERDAVERAIHTGLAPRAGALAAQFDEVLRVSTAAPRAAGR